MTVLECETRQSQRAFFLFHLMYTFSRLSRSPLYLRQFSRHQPIRTFSISTVKMVRISSIPNPQRSTSDFAGWHTWDVLIGRPASIVIRELLWECRLLWSVGPSFLSSASIEILMRAECPKQTSSQSTARMLVSLVVDSLQSSAIPSQDPC